MFEEVAFCIAWVMAAFVIAEVMQFIFKKRRWGENK